MKTAIKYLIVLTLAFGLSACASCNKNKKESLKDQCAKLALEEAQAQTAADEAKKTEDQVKTEELAKIEADKKAAPKPLEAVHTVKRGENLEKIAKLPEVYGNAGLWTVIFEANKKLLYHPSKIYPGQKLRIPRDAEEIAQLKKLARTDQVLKAAPKPVAVPKPVPVVKTEVLTPITGEPMKAVESAPLAPVVTETSSLEAKTEAPAGTALSTDASDDEPVELS